MLCEQCQEREATVHTVLVQWPSGELTKHLCESCYPAVEAARAKSYASSPTTSPPINVEQISALEYLEAGERVCCKWR